MRQVVLCWAYFLILICRNASLGQITADGFFSYSINTNSNTVSINRYDGPRFTNVTVPSAIGGRTVVDITKAFIYSEVYEVSLPGTLTFLDNEAFKESGLLTNMVIPASVTHIGSLAFQGCDNLKRVSFQGEELSSLGFGAFQDCARLESIRIPTNVETLPANLFRNCGSLTNVEVRGDLGVGIFGVGIQSDAFANCSSLRELTFGGRVGTVQDAFSGSGLTNVIFKDDVTTLGDLRFDLRFRYAFTGVNSLQSVTFEKNVTNVVRGFQDCAQLRQLNFLGDVGTISGNAFIKTPQLGEIYFRGRLTNIEDSAFAEMTGLRSLVLPRGLTNIGLLAFNGCVNLQEVVFLGTPPVIQAAAFRRCPPTLKLKYPKDSSAWVAHLNGRTFLAGQPVEPVITAAQVTQPPVLSGIRAGKNLSNSLILGGKGNVAGSFEFEAPETRFPAAGLYTVAVRFIPAPALWYVEPASTNLPLMVYAQMPDILESGTLTATNGVRFFHQIQAKDTSFYGQSNLPAGLRVDPARGWISGVPKEAGNYEVTLFASNGLAPRAEKKITLRVVRGVLTNFIPPASSTLLAGQPLSVSRLTKGTARNDETTVPGTFSWLVPDRRPAAGTTQQKVRFSPADAVNYAPAVLSVPVKVLGITNPGKQETLFLGKKLSRPFTIQANFPATRYEVSGLPPGLQLNAQTGRITGRPQSAGTFVTTLVAWRGPADAFTARQTFRVVRPTVRDHFQQALSLLSVRGSRP